MIWKECGFVHRAACNGFKALIGDSVPDHLPFEIRLPAEHTVPFVFNSPHSGRIYTESFVKSSRLDAHTIRRSEDYFVDELFSAAPDAGAALLAAHFPRAFIDVNREPYELDPRMFNGRVPSYINANSMRVAGGLGTIPRLVAENMEIYRNRLSIEEGLARIDRFYRPYHERLRKLLVKTHSRFGYGVLIDCHSMPANAQAGNRNRLILLSEIAMVPAQRMRCRNWQSAYWRTLGIPFHATSPMLADLLLNTTVGQRAAPCVANRSQSGPLH